MATIGTLMAYIGADTSDLVRGVRESERHLKRFEGNTDKSLRSVGASFKRASSAVFGLQTAFVALGGYAVTRAISNVVNVRLQFEAMESSLKFATGSIQAASKEMEWLRTQSNRLGLDLLAAGSGFKTIAAAAKGTKLEGQGVREVFVAVSEAATVLRLSSDDTRGALNALSQMISKGNVSAEELRQQLGERLPGAFQIAARSMGVTTQQLNKMLDNGQVLASEFLPNFAAEVRRTFSDQVPEAAKSSQAAINRFKNSIADLKNEIAQSGLMDTLTDGMKDLTQTINNNKDGILDFIRVMNTLLQKTVDLLAFAGRGFAQIGGFLKKGWGDWKRWVEDIRSIPGFDISQKPMSLDEYRGLPENQAGQRFPIVMPPVEETKQSAQAVEVLTKNLNDYIGVLERSSFQLDNIKLMAESGDVSAFEAIRLEMQAYGEQLVYLKDQMKRTEPETEKWYELQNAVLGAETAIVTLGQSYVDLEQSIKTLGFNDILDDINVALAQGDISENRAIKEQIKVYERMVSVYEEGLAVHKEYTKGWFAQKKLANDAKLKLAELTKEYAEGAETSNEYLASAETYHSSHLSLVRETNDQIGSRLSLFGEENKALEQTLVTAEKRLEIESKIAEAQAWAQGEIVESVGKQTEAVSNQAKAAETTYKRMMENIQDATADAFYEAFDRGFDAFSDFMDSMKDLFKRTLAEMVAQAATQKIIMPVMAQTIGAFAPGLMGGAAQVGQTAGMLPSLQGFMGQGVMGASIGGITGAGILGSLGYSTIGGMIGLPQGGHSGLGAGLGASLGYIGGTWLGGVGGAMSGAALGAGGGVAAGAAAGSVVPVVGTIIGAIIGGLAGSLFGGSGYDDADAALVLGARGTGSEYHNLASSRYNFSSQAKDFNHQEGTINDNVVKYFDGLFGILDEQFGVAVDSILGSQGVQVFHHDKAEKIVRGEGGMEKLLKLYTDQMLDVYGEQIGAALKDSIATVIPGVVLDMDSEIFNQLENIGTSDQFDEALTNIGQVIQQIQAITGPIDDFIATMDMTDVQKQVWSLNRTYDQYRETLKALGVDLEQYVKLEQWRNAQMGLMLDSIMQPIDDFLATANMDDLQKSVWEINKAYTEYHKALQAVGADSSKFAKLEQWRSAQINKVVENLQSGVNSLMREQESLLTQQENLNQRYADLKKQEIEIFERANEQKEAVFSSIDDMVRELRGGQYAPVQSAEFFENQINRLFSAANSGTSEDVNTLLQYIPQYLDFMSGTQDIRFLTERIAQRLEDLKPAVEVNYQKMAVEETQGVRDQLTEVAGEIQKVQNEIRSVRAAIQQQQITIQQAAQTPAPAVAQVTYQAPQPTSASAPVQSQPRQPVVDTSYITTLVNYLKGVEAKYGAAYVQQYFGPNSAYKTNTSMRAAFKQIYGYEKGGLATELSFVGEKGAEWVVPTYEPERTNFLDAMGVDPEAIGRAIAKAMMEEGGGSNTIIVKIGERAVGDILVDEFDRNGRLQNKVAKIRRAS